MCGCVLFEISLATRECVNVLNNDSVSGYEIHEDSNYKNASEIIIPVDC